MDIAKLLQHDVSLRIHFNFYLFNAVRIYINSERKLFSTLVSTYLDV